MKVLVASTEDFIKLERAKLAAASAAGSSVVLTLDNTTGFFTNDYIVIGQEGSDQAELAQITNVSGETITVGSLALPHSVDDPIVKYRYNKRKFYGSVTGVAGTFTELTSYGSPVAIGVDNPQGTMLEYTGSEGYLYFLSTYYNSQTGVESAQTDANTVLANEAARYCGLYDIRKQAGLTQNPYIDDGRIEAKRKQAENEVNSYLIARYALPLANSANKPEIPFLVTRCAIMLAAGYLDFEEYGGEGEGVKWLGEARGILNSIQKGVQRLIDSTGAEFQTQAQTNIIRGSTPPTSPMFNSGQKF